MNFQDKRKNLITRITDWLSIYAVSIRTLSKNNDQSSAIYAENNIRDLLNFLLDLTLINGNKASQNIEGIDLFDNDKKYCIQITSTKTKDKIQESLKKTKELLGDTTGWKFRMMILSMEDDEIKKRKKDTTLTDPALSFDPSTDIWDLTWIKKQIDDLEINQLEKAYILCEKMFGTTASPALETPSIQYLTAIPPQTTLYGRAQELENLENTITENQHLVLVNGIGGIGKSALARKLFSKMRNNYDRIGWIPYKDNLKDSLIASITLPALQTIDQPEVRFSIIYQELLKNKKTLLFIDDVTHDSLEDEVLNQMAGLDHLSLVLTSRREYVEKFDSFPVDSLKPEDCIDLFYGYYGKPKKDHDLPIINHLVEWACYHTLTIELLAKAAKRESNINTYFTKLQENGFAAPKLKVNSKTVEEHIQMLYCMADFEEGSEPYRILWNLALMPTMNIPTEVEEWISADVNDFEELIQRGWIAYHDSENGSGYYMHALIKKIILSNGKVPENVANTLLTYVCNGNFFSKTQIYTEKQIRFKLIEEVMEHINVSDIMLYINISQAVADAANDLGYYEKLQNIFLKRIAIIKEQIDVESEKLKELYPEDILSNEKLSISDEEKINDLVSLLKSLEQEHDIEGLEIAKLHIDIADLYAKKKMYPEAETHYLLGVTTYEREYGEVHSETAQIYYRLVELYHNSKRYSESHDITLKLLNAFELLYGSDHPDTADIYEFLVDEYHEMKEYTNAKKNCQKAIYLREQYNGPEHLICIKDYLQMSQLYWEQNDIQEALKFFLKFYCAHVKHYIQKIEHDLTALLRLHNGDINSSLASIRAYDEEAYKITMCWINSQPEIIDNQ